MTWGVEHYEGGYFALFLGRFYLYWCSWRHGWEWSFHWFAPCCWVNVCLGPLEIGVYR